MSGSAGALLLALLVAGGLMLVLRSSSTSSRSRRPAGRRGGARRPARGRRSKPVGVRAQDAVIGALDRRAQQRRKVAAWTQRQERERKAAERQARRRQLTDTRPEVEPTDLDAL